MTGIRHGVGHTPIIHHKNPAKVQQQATPVKPEPAPKPIDLLANEHLLDGISQGPTAPVVAGATTKGSGVNPHVVTSDEAAKPAGSPGQALRYDADKPFGMNIVAGKQEVKPVIGLTTDAPESDTVDSQALRQNGKLGYIGTTGQSCHEVENHGATTTVCD